MRELLRWLFNLNGKELDQATEALSKDTAKQRLKLVLIQDRLEFCLLYTSPSPRDLSTSRMPSSA